jgi:endonuclease YncB( thermonuclease family)
MRKLIPILFLLLFITACQQDLLLPDLSGKTETEAVQVIEDLGLTPVLAYETDVTVTHGSFIRYEIGFVAGKKVEKGDEITLYIAKNGVILPDLSELTETEVVTQLDALDIDYTIAYEHKYSNDDYEFSRFLDLEAGELLPYNQELTVYITWNGALLPDVTNMLKYEIIDALEYDFIQNYTFEYIVNDDYEEDMFAGYKDLEIGYPAPDDGTITIYLYKNTFTDEDDVTLFISKYLMGEANSRAIEIYNPTDDAIDLADYHIALFTNGAMTPSSIVQLEGILASHDTYVLAYRGSSQAVIDKADQQTNLLMFDGNDTIQLRYKNNTYIDTIYEIGNQLFVMVGEHFIRNSSVTGGTRTFKLNEWDAYIPSYVAPLGTHPIQKPETIEINLTYLNNTWGSTTASGMVLVTLSGINDGDTASFSPGFEGDARVRFLGVDTPETYPVADPWGPEAKAYTTSVLTQPGATIYIQSDPYLGATETYGRSLGYVWVNGLLLNYDLIRHGYSYNYLSNDTKLVYGNRYLYRWFQDAERYARENSLGIHSS